MEAIMRLPLLAAAAVSLALAAPAAEAKSRLAWEGGFFGGKWIEETDFWSDREVKRTVYHREHQIFASNRACEAWLYKMRSTWQDMPRYSWCKRVRVSG
jgi:hypothetical protein